eukprot:scaffold273329_cov30-Tisochrysis_lutea.AAC.1
MDLGKQHHALVKRFDENFLAIEHLADDVPKRLAVHEEKLRQAQEIHSLELEKTRNELMARLKLAETEIDQRALMSEFWKLTREVQLASHAWFRTSCTLSRRQRWLASSPHQLM